MGTDIHGWVEVRLSGRFPPDEWHGIVRIDALVERDYRVFAQLFGIRNDERLVPLAARRGLPIDVSQDFLDAEDVGPNNPLEGVSWISWRELTGDVSTESGAMVSEGDFSASQRLAKTGRGWQLVFRMMELLSVAYGTDSVRLVVYFD